MSRASTERRAVARGPGDARVLSRSTLMTLRRVLHAYREGWLLEERLVAAARMAAEDARHRGVPAARMLVLLKREWAALEEVQVLPRIDARELLDRLVAASIRAYYEPAQGRRRTEAPAAARLPGERSAA